MTRYLINTKISGFRPLKRAENNDIFKHQLWVVRPFKPPPGNTRLVLRPLQHVRQIGRKSRRKTPSEKSQLSYFFVMTTPLSKLSNSTSFQRELCPFLSRFSSVFITFSVMRSEIRPYAHDLHRSVLAV